MDDCEGMCREGLEPSRPDGAWHSERQLSTNSSTCTRADRDARRESAGQGSNLPAPESAVGLQPTASPLRRPAEVMSRSSGKMSSRFGDPRRSGRRDSNPRPRAPQIRALTRLSYVPCARSTIRGNACCRGGGIRTHDLLLPKQSVGAEFERIEAKFAIFEIARCVPARVECVPARVSR